MTRGSLATVLTGLVCSMLAGCTLAAPVESDSVVTVFGPYRDGDAAGFGAVLDQFELNTGIAVRYTGTGSLAADLTDRVEEDDLPDIAIVPQPAVVDELFERDLLVPLAPAAAAAVRANYAPSSIDLMTEDNDLYGVLNRVALKSLVWYPPAVFEEFGYAVPTNWAQLLALTEEMERDGFEPWCFTIESFGATGWVGTDWIEDLVLRMYGLDIYQAWVAGEIAFTDDRIRQAFEQFGAIVRTPGKVNGGIRRALEVNWANAGSPMFQEPPGCLLHRQASFYQAQLPSTIQFPDDIDVFTLPPIDGAPAPLLASGDLAVAFDDRPEVHALLAFLATPDSAAPWAAIGGYTSPHATFEVDNYVDEFDRLIGETLVSAETVAFDGSDQMAPAVGTGTFWTGIVDYVRTGDLDATLAHIQSGWDATTDS